MSACINTLFYTLWAGILCLSATVYGQSLNDTGIGYAGQYPKGNIGLCGELAAAESLKKDLAPIASQDCAVGESNQVDTLNDSVFSFQKIAGNGLILSDSEDAWQCVNDQTTELMWEVKNAINVDNPHYYQHKFTWYNSHRTSHGGNIGDWNSSGDDCQGYEAKDPRSYCNIEQFVSRVNKHGLCGFHDWRIPTRAELTSIIDFGQFQPAIDLDYFPHTLDTFYWVINPMANRPIEAWSVDFEFGTTSGLRKTDKRPVRLVRDSKNESND